MVIKEAKKKAKKQKTKEEGEEDGMKTLLMNCRGGEEET